MKDLLQDIGINIGISVAGLFGSLILIGKNAAFRWKTSIFSIITGVASANYMTPVAVDFIKLNEKYQMSIAFILGFLGLKGVELISNKISKNVSNVDDNKRDS